MDLMEEELEGNGGFYMGFFKSPADMFEHRAERFQREGNEHWAKAKSGEGDYHYGKAKWCYGQEKENREKAEHARKSNAAF
jgi:hypothetical protein